MSVLARDVARFLRDEEGATVIEYTIIAAGISVAIVAVLQSIGSSVVGMYSTVAAAFN